VIDFKFPSTPYIIQHRDQTKDDKALADKEKERFLNSVLTVQEKIDGANLGIMIDEDGKIQYQNRGKLISSATHKQWEHLTKWELKNEKALRKILNPPKSKILFGEWVRLQHSIPYKKLPDYFLVFDLYEFVPDVPNGGCFWSSKKLENTVKPEGFWTVPTIDIKKFSMAELTELLESASSYREGHLEGLYLRINDDEKGVCVGRAKYVRPEFSQAIDLHWTKSGYVKNEEDHTIYKSDSSVDDSKSSTTTDS